MSAAIVRIATRWALKWALGAETHTTDIYYRDAAHAQRVAKWATERRAS